MAQGKVPVGRGDLKQARGGALCLRRDVLESRQLLLKALAQEREQEGLFIGKVFVNGGRAVLDALGETAHGHGLPSLFGGNLQGSL